MNIFYCEACGKRITDDELAQSGPSPDAESPRRCAACGGHTKRRTATVERPRAAAQPSSRETAHAPRVRAPGEAPPSGAARRAEPGTPKRYAGDVHAGEPKAKPARNWVVFAVIVGVGCPLAVLIGLLLMPSDKKPDSKPPHSVPSPAAKAPSPSAVVSKDPPAGPTKAVPEGTVTKETPVAPPTLSADAAFEQLTKELAGLPPDDKDGRIAKLEAFLNRYSGEIIAARARVMLSELKKPPAPLEPAPAEKTPPLPVAPTGEAQKIFNGADLSNWVVAKGDKSLVRVEDGVMVLDRDFTGRLDVEIRPKSYTLEIEFFMEDATGAYFEFHTEHGGVGADRRCAGDWAKIRIDDRDGKAIGKTLAGKEGLAQNLDAYPGHLGIYVMKGAAKKIRAINLYENPAP